MEGRGFSGFYRNSSEEMFLKALMESSVGMPIPTMEMLGFKNLSQNFRTDSEELFKSWLTNAEARVCISSFSGFDFSLTATVQDWSMRSFQMGSHFEAFQDFTNQTAVIINTQPCPVVSFIEVTAITTGLLIFLHKNLWQNAGFFSQS